MKIRVSRKGTSLRHEDFFIAAIARKATGIPCRSVHPIFKIDSDSRWVDLWEVVIG